MEINNTNDLHKAVSNGPYMWPGGYPLYFLADDGEALSYSAVVQNYIEVKDSVRRAINDGWRVIGMDVNWEDPNLYCAHTGNKIEPAYIVA